MSRALNEESKARVLAPTVLCDLRQAVDISGSQVRERSWDPPLSPGSKGEGWSQVFFLLFYFQHKGLE